MSYRQYQAESTAPLCARSLSEAIAARRLTPAALTQDYLRRIHARNDALHAYTAVYAEDASKAAQASDSAIRAGHKIGPWHGIPVAFKDVIDIGGQFTTAGAMAWKDRRAEHTATVVTRLVRAGMVILGKTHAVEFALGGWGTNPLMGTPWNPWDPATHRIPGGSSSGSAVAVAAGLAPWALGTDTGGSIRMPAGYCGLTGFKPTVGRISTHGVVPLSQTMDTVGPLAWTAEDCASLYSVLQGPDPLDSKTIIAAMDDPAPALRLGVKGLRLARMPDAEREGVDDATLQAYDAALRALRDAGAIIEPIRLPCRFDDYAPTNACIIAAEAYANLGAVAHDESQPMDPVVRGWILSGASVTAREYLEALWKRGRQVAEFEAVLAPFDALLTPTTETTAMPVADVDYNKKLSRYTRVANYLDLCALSLPNGVDANGLPTSLQLICKRHGDSTALRIGYAYQQVSAWHLRRPILSNAGYRIAPIR